MTARQRADDIVIVRRNDEGCSATQKLDFLRHRQAWKRHRELAVLYDIGSDLTRSLGPTEILDRATLKVLEHFKVAAVRIYLMDEAEECLELVAYKGIAKGPVGRTASNWGH